MNEQRTSSGDRGDDQTPAELRSIEALLGHLGAADRADADAALEERLLAQTRELMIDREAVAEVHGGMEMLGRRERGGGAEGLEQRLYAATRGQLIGARRNAGGRGGGGSQEDGARVDDRRGGAGRGRRGAVSVLDADRAEHR